jgi:hypothetical protein
MRRDGAVAALLEESREGAIGGVFGEMGGEPRQGGKRGWHNSKGRADPASKAPVWITPPSLVSSQVKVTGELPSPFTPT